MSKTRSAEEKLNAVVSGARSILEKESFADSARAIFDYACEMTGAVSGYVALLDDHGQENEVLFLEAGGMPCTVDPDLPMPIRGLRAESYKSGKAVYDNDFMNSEWVKYMPEGHVEMRNVMFAPLNLDGKTVGIIGLANKSSDFTDADADIASVFGELAAIGLRLSRGRDLLLEKNQKLEESMTRIKKLHGLLPMCAKCKNVRDDDGYWSQVEEYLTTHTDAEISHGLCPDCARELYPDEAEEILGEL